MEVFENDKSIDFVHSGGIRHDEEGHSPGLHPRLSRGDGTYVDERRVLTFCDAHDIDRFLEWGNVILSHTFVARSELLVPDVLDDPQLDVMEDVYLYLIFLARGAKFAFNGRATAVWNWRVRSHDNSMVNYEMMRRTEQAERIIRRLGQYRFSRNSLGENVIGRIDSAPPVVHEQRQGDVVYDAALEERQGDVVYDAALEEQVSLRKPGRPSFLSSVQGLSFHEDWGRWTEGESAEFTFWHPLPKSFEFEFVARPAPAMVGKTVTIVVGSCSKVITLKSESLRTYSVPIRHNNGANNIVIRITNPVSPAEAGNDPNGDPRKLGIALTSFRIVPKRKFAFA